MSTAPLPQVTVPARGIAGALDREARRMVLAGLARLGAGRLVVREAGATHVLGPGGDGAPSATIDVRDSRFWSEVAFGGALGAAESYARGEWDVDDLTALARLMARAQAVLDGLGGWTWLREPVARAFHALRRNTRGGARRNIEAHYDLGNEFFARFLDPTMMYSCAIYPRADATLDEAAVHKLDVVCRRLGFAPGMRVLEIGTGWGGFAIHAASRHGVHVTTTTISREQEREALARIAAAGLSDRVTVLREDYRDLERALGGRRFDRVVSIEMIEAVGAEYLGDYFAAIGRLLADDGHALVQAIVIRDQDEAAYRRTVDFIQRWIFPGGCLPSVRGMVDAVARRTPLRVAGLEDHTPHYARTLADWRARFRAHSAEFAAMGFGETFQRLWHWYFGYCEGGFLERRCGLVHLRLAGPRAGAIEPPA